MLNSFLNSSVLLLFQCVAGGSQEGTELPRAHTQVQPEIAVETRVVLVAKTVRHLTDVVPPDG